MRTMISGLDNTDESGMVGPHRNSVRTMSLVRGALLLDGLPGCLSFGAMKIPTRRRPETLQRQRSIEKWRKWSSSIEYAFRNTKRTHSRLKKIAACTKMSSGTWPLTI